MKTCILAVCGGLIFSVSTSAQISFNGAYSQNFDALPNTATSSAGTTWTDNATLPGWYASTTAIGSTAGTANTEFLKSFGTPTSATAASSSTERALGSIANANTIYFGLALVNNTGRISPRSM